MDEWSQGHHQLGKTGRCHQPEAARLGRPVNPLCKAGGSQDAGVGSRQVRLVPWTNKELSITPQAS